MGNYKPYQFTVTKFTHPRGRGPFVHEVVNNDTGGHYRVWANNTAPFILRIVNLNTERNILVDGELGSAIALALQNHFNALRGVEARAPR